MLTSTIAATGLAASLLLAPTTGNLAEDSAADAPPGAVAIAAVTVNGSGCPPGTADVSLSRGNTVLTVTYHEFFTVVGPGAAATDFRKNCQLNLDIRPPAGFSYALAGVTHKGFAALATGASATLRTSTYFQGSSTTTAVSHTFTGPTGTSFTARDSFAPSALTFSPCGAARNLNINTEIRLNAGTSDARRSSFVVVGSTELDTGSSYSLVWRRCPAAG